MPLSAPRLHEPPHHLHLHWLLRLRWLALACQLALVVTAWSLLQMSLPVGPVLGLLAASLGLNVALTAWTRSSRADVGEMVIATVVAIDSVLLTGLLWLTGGPMNPFSFLYLVQIALAAVVLSARWNVALVVLSVAAYGLLFLIPNPGEHHHHHGHHQGDMMSLHLQGMWVAFAITAPALALGVGRVRAALKRYDVELATARETHERAAQLESLTTLAAGAAHELSSPLATIAIAALEMERAAAQLQTPGLLEDAKLVREEVRRCRTILHQMAADLGGGMGESLSWEDLRTWVERELDTLPDRSRITVDLPEDTQVRVAPRLLGQVLRALATNALDASDPEGTVELVGRVTQDHLVLHLHDHGRGMSDDVLARSMEPFFTTKPTGSGLGLGLFFCHSVVRRLGGELHLTSTEGRGTSVRLALPHHAERFEHEARLRMEA